MRIAIIATCGLAFLCTSSVRAQESVCGEPPPMFAHSSQVSVEASASFLSKLISSLGLGASREVKVDEVLSRYPNPHELLLKAYNVAIQCKMIMGSSWNLETKLKVLNEVVVDMVRLESTPYQPTPSPSPVPSPDPMPSFDEGPAGFEISGQYFSTSRLSTGGHVDLVLDVRSGPEGTFVGNVGDPSSPQVSHLIVEGRTVGDTVTFTARPPTGDYDWLINFEGKFTGNSIRGRSRVVSPSQGVAPWEQLEFAASRRSYVDPGPALQIAQRPEMCCVYDPANWCAPWSSRPGRAYENENITYAELGSACYCPGRDEPGRVMPANGFCS